MASLGKSALLMVMERVIRSFTGIVVSVSIARYLGVEQYGQFSYVTALVGMFIVFGQFGTDHLLLKDWREATEQTRGSILTNVFIVRLLGACLAILVLISYVYISGDALRKEIFIYALVLLAVGLNVFEPLNLAEQLGSRMSVAQFSVNILSSILKLTAVFLEWSLASILIVYLTESLLQSVGNFSVHIVYGKRALGFVLPSLSKIRSILVRAFPLVLDGFVVLAYMKVDQLLVGQLLGMAALGQYAVAVRLVEFSYIIPVVLVGVFNTFIYKNDAYRSSNFGQLMSLLTLISIIGLMVACLVGRVFISFLYGADFSNSGLILQIYVLALPIVFWGVASARWLIEAGQQKHLLCRNLVGFLVNIVLNVLLIPILGITGAAIATLVSQFCSVILYMWFIGNLRPILVLQLASLKVLYRPSLFLLALANLKSAR